MTKRSDDLLRLHDRSVGICEVWWRRLYLATSLAVTASKFEVLCKRPSFTQKVCCLKQVVLMPEHSS